MANQIEDRLIQPLLNRLQNEHFVLISTVDYESGGPYVTVISWVYAPRENKIIFAIDNRARTLQNIKNNPHIVISMIANESTYAISGKATVKEDRLEGVPLHLALVELDIERVRDVMFYGSKISSEPNYEKTYDENAAKKLDKQVMEALKKRSV